MINFQIEYNNALTLVRIQKLTFVFLVINKVNAARGYTSHS